MYQFLLQHVQSVRVFTSWKKNIPCGYFLLVQDFNRAALLSGFGIGTLMSVIHQIIFEKVGCINQVL